MRVLLCHNYYGSGAPSGENRVFEAERALLERRGHATETFVAHSDGIRGQGVLGALRGGLATPWNPYRAWQIRRLVERWRPDVVHVHNTFPLLSPAIFSAIGGRASRVLTLHNYRLACPAAIPLREGRPCTECVGGSVLSALRYGCYRRSRVATLPLAIGVALHKALGTWNRHVDAFIALSEFQRDMMVAAGLPRARLWVKPNFVMGRPKVVEWAQRGNHVVFVGRLSEEKGVADLVAAWSAWGAAGPQLRIIGDGPLRSTLEARVRLDRLENVRILGQLTRAATSAEVARARLIVAPSVCFEGFPLVLAEAFSHGTPAAVADIGSLPQIVANGRSGVVFPPRDPDALLRTVRETWGSPALARMAASARQEFEEKYSEESNYSELLRIYERADEVKRKAVA